MGDVPTHSDQYKMLRDEIVQHMRETNQTESAGALAIGAAYAWLLVHKDSVTSQAIWFVPPVILLLCSIRCLVLTISIRQIAKYLRKIEEEAFGGNRTLPGWERYIAKGANRWLINGPASASVFLWILTISLSFTLSWWFSSQVPNKTPEQTPTSVMPPAGQEARQP
jgi:hypothetical protein